MIGQSTNVLVTIVDDNNDDNDDEKEDVVDDRANDASVHANLDPVVKSKILSSPAMYALYSLLSLSLIHSRLFHSLSASSSPSSSSSSSSFSSSSSSSFLSTPRGLLLHGPPGVGKTFAVRLVCAALRLPVLIVDAQSLYGGSSSSGSGGRGGGGGGEGGVDVGDVERRLRQTFSDARNLKSNNSDDGGSNSNSNSVVIFIDEIDVSCPKRDAIGAQSSTHSTRIVATLLTLMDGAESSSSPSSSSSSASSSSLSHRTRNRVFVIGATNRVNSVDDALRRPGRFDREIAVPPPDVSARADILRGYLKNLSTVDVDIAEFADRMIGYVGADIEAVCREAALKAIFRAQSNKTTLSTKSIVVAKQDLESAMLLVPASSLRDTSFSLTLPPPLSSSSSVSSSSSSHFLSIGGLSSVKRQLLSLIEWPLLYPDAFKKLGVKLQKGILLHGPPGCAKEINPCSRKNLFPLMFRNMVGNTQEHGFLQNMD